MMDATMTTKETRMERATRICDIADLNGTYENDRYRLELGEEGSADIRVRDRVSGHLVAFSSTSADYDLSLEEFVLDYMVD